MDQPRLIAAARTLSGSQEPCTSQLPQAKTRSRGRWKDTVKGVREGQEHECHQGAGQVAASRQGTGDRSISPGEAPK